MRANYLKNFGAVEPPLAATQLARPLSLACISKNQHARDDCGVFMLSFIEHLSVGEPISFAQDDMNAKRARIGVSILQGEHV